MALEVWPITALEQELNETRLEYLDITEYMARMLSRTTEHVSKGLRSQQRGSYRLSIG